MLRVVVQGTRSSDSTGFSLHYSLMSINFFHTSQRQEEKAHQSIKEKW